MTITLRIVVHEDATSEVIRDPSLATAVDLSATTIELDATDPSFHRLLDVTRDTPGAWLKPVMHFSPREMAQARYFQLECRGRIIRETPVDQELNRAHLEATAFVRANQRPLRIKVVDRIALSRIALPPNMIGCATEWMGEFVLGRATADTFRAENFRGFGVLPVFNPVLDADHTEYFHLYTEHIMPAAELDETTPGMERESPDDGGWRELGCLTYDLAGQEPPADFNRTAENWSASFIPLWIVSARVRDAYERHGLKGWAFRPILEKGTPLHVQYVRAWNELLARVRVNPRNRF